MKHKKVKYIAIFLVLFALIVIPLTYSKYIKKYTKQLSISAIQPTYKIVFDANGGSGTMEKQTLTYKSPANLYANTFINGTLVFDKWTTESDGTGDEYYDEEEVVNLTTVNGDEITLYAQWVDKAARIGKTYYDTLSEAIDDVYTSSPQTTIVLLKDVNENIEILSGIDIILDLNHKTITNVGNNNTVKNRGHLVLKNGNIRCNATTNGAVNNYTNGVMSVEGVNITVFGTGNRQALWNEKGTVSISGGSVLTSLAVDRCAVTNTGGNSAVMTVTDATIVSTGSCGLINSGVLTIGTSDENISAVTPSITGVTHGLETTTNVSFYDGIIKGVESAVDNPNRLINIPNGYGAMDGLEDIDGVDYKTKYIGIGVTVTFDPNTGNTTEASRYLPAGYAIGTLPECTKSGYTCDGWFTEKTDGEQIDETFVVEEDTTIYAHYTKNKDAVEIVGVRYDSIEEAMQQIPDHTPTTIVLLQDIHETVVIPSTKEITIDLNGHTLTNAGVTPVITNNGDLTLMNGTVISSTDMATINQDAGVLNIISGEVIALGTRGAIYAVGGTVNISGTAYLSSNATGTPNNSTMDRGTVQILANATLNVTGGTIIGNKQQAISNIGTTNIGISDGTIDATSPVIQGATYGIKTTGTLNFYDGIIKGKTAVINGNITDREVNSTIVNGTEVINEETYQTMYLEIN